MDSYFVHKPAVAWVIALFIALFGTMALINLPIEQYPAVAPPSLTLSYTYNGADAETMDKNVTAVVEREMNGVPNFLYMSSTSRANGTGEIVVTFTSGTDLDVARTQVQDRLNRAEPRLPEDVRRLGIQIADNASGFLEVIVLKSRTGATSPLDLGDFASTKVVNELRRVPGVGNVSLFSSEKAMRVWLDPEKLAGYSLSASDALAAVQEQNSQTAGGGLAEQPLAPGSSFNARIVTQNRFTTAEQFRDIIVRANPDGSTVRLGDVARVELAADNYNFKSTLDGKEVAGLAVQLSSGSNAIATKNALSARMTELERSFPKDITWAVSYDTTPFIQASIDNVIQTLVEAMLLVFLVMFLFLQSWRATVIPALVVPIALLGGCLGLWAFGFSINQLSLFAMVVAIGILVDDAIVVVENVERIMAEEGLSPARATIKAMGQIRGAIIGITAVLIAVFLPMAFFPGSTGGIYRQFSVTLAVSIFFSALLALTLTPALCATLLKPHTHKPGHTPEPRSGWRGWPQRFFNGFNDRFTRSTDRYAGGVAAMLSRPLRWLAVFVAVVGVTWLLFARLPGGFLPEEDQGYFVINYDAPPAATMAQTEAAVKAVETEFAKLPQSQEIFSVIGFNFFGQGQTAGLSWAMLKPFDERKGKDLSVDSAIGAVFGAAANVPGANIFAINPPAIDSLGNATGFTMKIEDRGGNDPAGLQAALGAILGAASQNPKLAGVRPEGQPPSPQLYVDIDRVQARALGLSIADVNATLSIAFGSAYANDFSNEGNVQRVYLQADAPQRMTEDDVLNLRVRGSSGQMVPFSAFTKVHWMQGATQLQRYNGYPSLTISGQAAPGESSGTALKEMEKIADQILKGSQSYEWTGTAFEEKQAGGQIGLLLGLSLIVVFLLLVGLYNSWAIPLSVLLVVPFGVLGAVLFTMLRGLSADVYFNIGLITIIGLAAKNAILVVEFAIEDEVGDRTPLQATLEAARQRLRPILMTSLAFILGMVPLVIAGGAGSASRHAVGTGVMGGMIAATAFGIFFTPLFYFAARKWLSRASVHHASDAEEPKPLPPTATPDEGGTAHA
ncbi:MULTISPECIES: multidrug efflux RND transporter permease subunit [Sphingomonadaceae]|jgi:multidrug efflux pump|uniref:multidrug efflux RND transporter permease subunit n=1 Tax=Sphingomonadales TaxID=204457 RepID=UPI000361E95D|nr:MULTISPECIES: multidrug efflux RND transporter permease subunit [Sphingomonadaceae]AXJ97529.1 multidrug efflux RND transporter permease subunit [Sphingomonas sp. FARSPH]MBP7637583.1 multidrug efflux RND transporter permease subunit [Kiritimatiellia bacterium]MBS0503386.1 multidrug efflux RND transporter permease subunit [Pseudomonadota bacterium]